MAEPDPLAVTRYKSMRELAEWMASAPAEPELVYATGPALDPREGPAHLVAQWLQAGSVQAFKRRDPGTRALHHVVRKAKVTPPSALRAATSPSEKDGEDRRVEFDPDSPEGRVLAVLRRCANLGQPCPSNDTIADLLDLKDRAAAGYRVRVLAKAGLIRIDEPARFGARVVTIVSSGRSTAAPDTSTRGQGGRTITREISA